MTVVVDHYIKEFGRLNGRWEVKDGEYKTLASCGSKKEAAVRLALLGKRFAFRPDSFDWGSWTRWYTVEV